MESWTRLLRGHIFYCSRGNRTFVFGIYWNSTNLAYVPQFGLWFWFRGLVYDYPFLRESHSVPGMDFFCYVVTYFVPFGVIESRVTKVNSKYINENHHHFICPGWSILYLYVPAHKPWLFGKFIFELDTSSFSFKIPCSRKWSHLLKKYSMENFIFCAVNYFLYMVYLIKVDMSFS